MKTIAITGEIYSGKSLVLSIIEKYGGCTFTVDTMVYELLSRDSVYFNQLVKMFGQRILTNGRIDKKKLGKVLCQERKFETVKNMLIPELTKEIKKRLQQYELSGHTHVFIEIPLLGISDLRFLFDEIVIVATSDSVKRMIDNENTSEAEARRMVSALGIARDYKDIATIVILNNSTAEDLTDEVEKMLKRVGMLVDD